MKKSISWLKRVCLVFLVAVTFLAIPAFSYSAQAASDDYSVDKKTVERVKDMAEDHVGDRDGIGNTGLKNIKKLGENIPETVNLNYRLRHDNDRAADLGDPRVVQDNSSLATDRVKEYNRD